MRIAYLLVLLPALVGAALGGMAYFQPETGVDGTPGALLALVGAAASAIGAILLMLPSTSGGIRTLLKLLTGLAALLTAIAAWFLMQYAFAIAMALALLGLAVALALPDRRTAA